MSHTLLLADDSVTIRRVIELTFADERVKVVSVSNGREALDRVAAEAPDIVLADIGMADVSGYEIASFIKGRADLRHIPVVLLAGAFEPLDEVKAREAGSDAVLVKPFEPQMVVARVRELLARPAGAAPAPPRPAAAPAARAAAGPVAPAPVAPPAPLAPQTPPAPPAPAAARPQGRAGRSMPLDPEPIRAASGSNTTDPSFDASLDRLDAAFADAHGPSMAAEVVDDFAQDLRELQSSRPGGDRGDAAFARDEFGDWDLPSRVVPAAPADDSFAAAFDAPADAPPTLEPVAEPPRLIAPAPRPPVAMPPAESPAAALPPPVTLEPRVEVARAQVPAPTPATPPSAARAASAPSAVAAPLADAFSSLLAAEEGRPPLAAYVQMPAYDAAPPAAPVAAAGGQIPDEVIDRIVDKVVARLGAGVRGTVLDLAERLVRAEIDRLKALR